jgi:N-acyl-D-amino-acid deacylase
LKPGYAADVTLFDPSEFAERATYDDPHQYPAGKTTTVLVNGVVTVDHADHTGALAGKLLRRLSAGA